MSFLINPYIHVTGGGSSVPVLESITTTIEGTSVTTFTADMPSTRPDDDLYIMLAVKDDDPTIPLEDTTSWVEVQSSKVGTVVRVKSWWKIGSSEPASYSATIDSETYIVYVLRISGANATTPINASALQTSTNGTTKTSPTVTTTVDNCLVIRFSGSNDTTDTYPTQTEYTATPATEQAKNYSFENGTAGACECAFSTEEKLTAGATGTADFTLSASEAGASITIAIAPA